MEAFLKPPILLVGALIVCVFTLAACAMPGKATINQVITSPGADLAAVRVEFVVATMANSFAAVVQDPAANVDRAKLGRQIDRAADILDRARTAFDQRGGGVYALVKEALAVVSDALPAGTSLAARFALSTAFTGLSMYAGGLDVEGPPVEPSKALVEARKQTDDALAALRALLPAPSS